MSNQTVTSADIRAAEHPLTCLTCYDFLTARVMDRVAELDMILVGDSLGMVSLGYESTLPVTVDDMVHHTAAVSRGVNRAFVVADVPFMSMAKSKSHAVTVAQRLMQEGGAQAIKIEGGERHREVINHLVSHDVPVVGHLGLTPQSVEAMGGYKLQANEPDKIKQLSMDANILQKAGVLSIVLECIPAEVGDALTMKLDVPTIGIGAGNGCDGQVLVWQDMMGLSDTDPPKFVKEYDQFGDHFADKIREYCNDVRNRDFPDEEHSFTLGEDVSMDQVKDWVDVK
ncbi:MAG: 3-methyl-2-oxobutanoate hydroxymethyltransferase [bacterium]